MEVLQKNYIDSEKGINRSHKTYWTNMTYVWYNTKG
ncbi:MAG: hypothetical protein UY47_C0001G0005 [Parcubacteria group bacterium GW2011_GWB1_49_7]|nr:MAG: hypothetical protein UX71_C0012G0003 [Parcubacteria group bacterium GW2011_GWA1_47_10]KKW10057.1 MAG: hypothetical protein UY47_C0001G0005 [Parcubacteria group bacterium GW2011_GWB1_49_7]